MRYLVIALLSIVFSCQQKAEQVTSPYVVKQDSVIYWVVTPAMDSLTFHILSQALLDHSIFFKPDVDRDEQGRLTKLSGNILAFDKKRIKLNDTLLSNRLILPKQRQQWLASQSISVGHTKATLHIPPLGFWYDPLSGLHSDIVGENFPKSLREQVEKEFPSTAVAELEEQNKRLIKNFKAALSKGKPAFDFSLPDSTGKQIRLSDYRGKVIYLDFWAHWCGACMEEMERLKNGEKRLKNHSDLALLYVSVDKPKDKDKWINSLRKHKFMGVHLLANSTDERSLSRSYGINALPTKFIIDRNGNFYATYLPYGEDEESIIRLLENALAEK
ncbi:TlpA family protein disulfide reductase [Spirosoma litoris]